MILRENYRSACRILLRSLIYIAVGFTVFPDVQAKEYTPAYVLDVQENGGLKTYNGVYPGPVMRVSPGESLDVELINSLPALNDDCTGNMNRTHGLNTTNLHPHGLHVSPAFDSSGEFFSDNVFVSLVPENQIVECDMEGHGEGHGMMMNYVWGKAQYRFELPEDHMTGTFWYHAHKHGSTAEQVGNGLAGPLIVEDKPGYLPAYIEQANEKIFVLSNRGLYLAKDEGGGTLDPTIVIAPGEVQRWRIINAMGNGSQYHIPRLSLEGLEVYLIAYDGFTLEKRIPINTENFETPWLNPASLASGNRMDLVVRAPFDYVSTKNTIDRPRQSLFSFITGSALARVFDINIELGGVPVSMEWSVDHGLPGAGLEPFDNREESRRTLSFTGPDSIDGDKFDGAVKQTMVVGTTEDWTVSNRTGQLHIYHIHVNPFFITHLNGQELPADSPLRRWQDTLGIPVRENGQPGSMRFKTRFERFTGQFVLHCHVLVHEDRGMMQIVEVVGE